MILWLKKSVRSFLRAMDLLLPFGKPSLDYMETHLVDHCNMNCCGCSHFSPLAEPWFADLAQFTRDLEQLSALFRTIRKIRLMGGEPLLHPQVERFIALARTQFPAARIQLVTNGILLRKMTDSFWRACREHHVVLAITVYPPMKAQEGALVNMCRERGVPVVLTPVEKFCVWMNKQGDSPQVASFKRCRSMVYCPVLKDGRLYVCATAAYIHFFNKKFGLSLPSDLGIDLNTTGLTGRLVLKKLNEPVPLCRFCALDKELATWQNCISDEGAWFVKKGLKQ